eukprot:COSAG01_NODE_32866_length_574_cov_0.637895_1_plen_31_part_10
MAEAARGRGGRWLSTAAAPEGEAVDRSERGC